MPKIFAQKRAALLVRFVLVLRSASVFSITISGASPIVSCGNR